MDSLEELNILSLGISDGLSHQVFVHPVIFQHQEVIGILSVGVTRVRHPIFHLLDYLLGPCSLHSIKDLVLKYIILLNTLQVAMDPEPILCHFLFFLALVGYWGPHEVEASLSWKPG